MARVLIVDDEPAFCEELAAFLGEGGYQALVAHDGEEALGLVREERPHLMLLDIRMPGICGFEVLRRVREFDAEIGIIMVTAIRDREKAREALALGADDYIMKPLDLSDLMAKVNELTG